MKEFSVLTWNIGNCNENLKNVLEIILLSKTDIVLLQECFRRNYEEIFNFAKMNGYKSYLPDETKRKDFGELVLSKFPFSQFCFQKFFKSKQNRGITKIVVDIDREDYVVIATSQLEGGDYSYSLKKNQGEIINKLRDNETKPIIFAGDFQVTEFQKDVDNILTSDGCWYDVWDEVGNKNNYFTIDFETNYQVQPPLQERPDRIYFTSRERDIVCKEMKLIGKDVDFRPCFHYGIRAVFCVED